MMEDSNITLKLQCSSKIDIKLLCCVYKCLILLGCGDVASISSVGRIRINA